MLTSSFATPVLAQVTTPQGFQYVLHAENHLGFVVERRYRRVAQQPADYADPLVDDLYEPYLHPFISIPEVRLLGMRLEAAEQWLDTHPGEAFAHPLYASLCLRWGENPCGWQVYPYPTWAEPPVALAWNLPPAPTPLWVVPRTAWRTGRTYYQLTVSPQEDMLLWMALANTDLARHEADQEGEGQWEGYYTCDWLELQAIAAQQLPTPRTALLRRPPLPRFRVQVYQAPGWLREERLATTAEEAWALYVAAPEAETVRFPGEAEVYPRLLVAREDETGQWWSFAEKAVNPEVSLDRLPWPASPLLVPRSAWGKPHQPVSASWRPLVNHSRRL